MYRDLETNPYSPDEQRVASFFFDRGMGGGDDPIGALFASYEYIVVERNVLLKKIEQLHRCLGFFASVIKSGESWTETCQRNYDACKNEKVK